MNIFRKIAIYLAALGLLATLCPSAFAGGTMKFDGIVVGAGGITQIIGNNVRFKIDSYGNITDPVGIFTFNGVPLTGAGITQNLRVRIPIASINAGYTLLPAVAEHGYAARECRIIAIGGAVTSTTATGIAIYGTQSTSQVALVTDAKANLTQNTVNTLGNFTILPAGASYITCDNKTAITIQAVGGTDLAGATYIDVILLYSMT